MQVSLPTILASDTGPDLVSKLNQAFAAIQASFGLDQVLSADLTIPTNRSQVTCDQVDVATFTLTLEGTAILCIE